MSEKINPIAILVLQRGWVAVGKIDQKGSQVTLTDASIVRKWGTTKGLGQIANGGPTKSTVLDPVGTISVHELAIVMRMNCNQEKWAVDHAVAA